MPSRRPPPALQALNDLIVVPMIARSAGQVLQAERWKALQSRFADDECLHGRLPGDRTPPCGCWPLQEEERTARRRNPADGRGAALEVASGQTVRG